MGAPTDDFVLLHTAWAGHRRTRPPAGCSDSPRRRPHPESPRRATAGGDRGATGEAGLQPTRPTVNARTLRDGAVDVVRLLRDRGFEAYWVGGCVRDLEMGREPHDYDIATSARPSEVATLFENTVLVGVRFGVVIVTLDGYHYEVSTFRAEGPYVDGRRPSRVEFVDAKTDVSRRDFTINGLLHDPLTGTTVRSEEHTSELQSLAYLVCRLLLEKKK